MTSGASRILDDYYRDGTSKKEDSYNLVISAKMATYAGIVKSFSSHNGCGFVKSSFTLGGLVVQAAVLNSDESIWHEIFQNANLCCMVRWPNHEQHSYSARALERRTARSQKNTSSAAKCIIHEARRSLQDNVNTVVMRRSTIHIRHLSSLSSETTTILIGRDS